MVPPIEHRTHDRQARRVCCHGNPHRPPSGLAAARPDQPCQHRARSPDNQTPGNCVRWQPKSCCIKHVLAQHTPNAQAVDQQPRTCPPFTHVLAVDASDLNSRFPPISVTRRACLNVRFRTLAGLRWMTWMGVEPSGRSWPNPERPVWGVQRQQADIRASSIIVAMHGMASSIVLGPSCPGEYETGPIGDHQCGLVLTHNRRCSSLSQTCLLIRRAPFRNAASCLPLSRQSATDPSKRSAVLHPFGLLGRAAGQGYEFEHAIVKRTARDSRFAGRTSIRLCVARSHPRTLRPTRRSSRRPGGPPALRCRASSGATAPPRHRSIGS